MSVKNWKPSLTEVSLKDIDKKGSGRIDTKKQYLARIDDEFYIGQFSKQWYGLNFEDGWGNCGHQFDPPGTNSSGWQQLWEISK